MFFQSVSRLFLTAFACCALALPTIASTTSTTTKDDPAAAAALDAAFTSPDRLKTDAEQDERRQSRAVLTFLGVKPGMRVIDVFSAGGYNTELLARAVGVKGEVIA